MPIKASSKEKGMGCRELMSVVAHIFFGLLVSYVILQEILYGKELTFLLRDRLLDSLMNLVMHESINT